MDALATIAFYLGVIAYSAASTLFFLDLARQTAPPPRSTWGPRLLVVAALLHAVHVVTASLVLQRCPVDSLHFGLSFSALVAVAAFLVLRRYASLDAVGVIVAPSALTFLVGAQFVGVEVTTDPLISRPLLVMHIAANVLGVGLFVVAGAAGLLFLVLERRLQTHRAAGLGGRLPSLDTLDRSMHRLLVGGFPLLTFGVVTGALFSRHLEDLSGAAFARTLFGFLTWVVLASVLVLRRVAGVRGRRAAYGTLAAVLCMFLVVVVYAVRPGGHGS
ncbi:MAG TPA: cytochrome c biogenesis protein CcsA [Polyangiaceae bacterium]|nr:cytochrome c biogenesis protein CcsA [Polyangiaceae bacterium]